MAAEVAAGAYIASEIIEHGAQAGYAAYLVSKPTLPLKVTFTRIATASDDHTKRSLVRSHHTVTVVANKAYIFGGTTADGFLASNDIHAVTVEHSGQPEMDYGLTPALPTIEGSKVPSPRTSHSACAFHGNVAVYGGRDETNDLVDEDSSMWFYSPERKTWDLLVPISVGSAPGPRRSAKLFESEGCIVLYGGHDATGDAASDLWRLDVASKTWTQLPTAPVATTNAALANGQLYLISSSDSVSGHLHHLGISLPVKEMAWESFTFPANPFAPGPRARHDGALLPVTTGWGRNYMIYLLGARDESSPSQDLNATEKMRTANKVTQFSDTWVLQIPSSDLDAKPSWSLKNAIKPAKIKDAIRHAIGAETGHLAWAEAVVQLPSGKQLGEEDGKLHPGPRAFFGADTMENGHSVVFWGGVDAKGQQIGDGWIVRFE
ncbi:hypothetical protein DE146DRAFT_646366 [Phaeosphaeria sp. MPI-PUGE-AT-0046c]|nr:hypothetical protein DE146DRAFT_646366 [Phaeosphaeria sp. MPI-PUGE-AT-0046c]